jgi:hypothetical protein
LNRLDEDKHLYLGMGSLDLAKHIQPINIGKLKIQDDEIKGIRLETGKAFQA